MGIGDALPIAQGLLERLRALPQVKQAEIAGSLRRRRETIGDVDLICSLSDSKVGADVSAAFVKFPEVQRGPGRRHHEGHGYSPPADFRSTFASFRSRTSGRRCSILPGPRITT